jgi:hypothetical protein
MFPQRTKTCMIWSCKRSPYTKRRGRASMAERGCRSGLQNVLFPRMTTAAYNYVAPVWLETVEKYLVCSQWGQAAVCQVAETASVAYLALPRVRV